MATTTVWAIGDLHLSIGLESEKQKPMDQFGASWVQHTAKIARSWCERVQAQDIVLLAGDIFWGNRVEEARFALNWLGCLPGRKVLVRGNHDNWWQSIGKVRAALPPRYRIALLHFPPFDDAGLAPEVAVLLEKYRVDLCVFGHLHGEEAARFRSIEKNNIKYVLASADYIDFSPLAVYNYQYNHD